MIHDRMYLDVTISKRLHFTSAGEPDYETYEIEAMVNTSDEEDSLGGISLESPDQVVQLYKALGNYIRMYDLDPETRFENYFENAEDAEIEGEEKS